ncbi:hypothetical protein DPSP01_012372 [Paraphaeosphaeria sporulosa]|uniref:Uncharacterized protein n=1 Tax=Paraphaeosphaeria sporulosa TaxID=1460663 RepID=A0A177CS05_9PLEO|nr:uncharacterized protein CC84DRAFT_478808 [Paraphaeosphaeria sporulosa]OAG10314.1 hypothetical protein CC84DRAFT_478808 [Paraphaeosphaeria sporulosa]
MVHFSIFPSIALYLFCVLPIIVALPTSRFNHDVQSLPPRNFQENPRTPPASHTHRFRKRGLPGAVYICTSDNFRGDCAWTAPNNRCHIAGTGNNSARSIGPDEDGFCVLFEKATCTGTQVKTLRFPGQASNMPTFMSLKCFSDGNGNGARANATATAVTSNILPDADPRLSGGVGSMERKNLENVMEQMEKDGFRQGMIGLKKGHYY